MKRALFACLTLLGVGHLAAQDPPVPSKADEEQSAFPAGLLEPLPATAMPPTHAADEPFPALVPNQLPAPSLMPDVPAIYAPEGGAEMPDIGEIPGLVLPKVAVKPQEALNEDEAKARKANPNGIPNTPNTPGRDLVTAKRLEWLPSPREARKRSIAERRPMVMVVGGFGWSPACRALNSDLLGHPAFQNMARANDLVLTVLNVPTKKVTEDPQKAAEWDAIARYREFLHLKGLPAVILFDPDGKEIDRVVGYNFSPSRRRGAFMDKMNRITGTVETEVNRLQKEKEKRQLLREVQNYRDWTSRLGTKFFAKISGKTLLAAPTDADPDATTPGVLLMDENGKQKPVALRLLSDADQEFVEIYWAEKAGAAAATTP